MPHMNLAFNSSFFLIEKRKCMLSGSSVSNFLDQMAPMVVVGDTPYLGTVKHPTEEKRRRQQETRRRKNVEGGMRKRQHTE
mmetsp:Transcript_25012/g.38926  ORF Transcript_25012/g.38926 Transcript_25012/m.38926 type:complete len:81 (+) Transcript_25012:241-483(+)